jgi:DNA repair protein SbcC/Rad50
MKILTIRIKNLASLDGVTEIDFTHEPLNSAGIFAITGSTGAGKSTILDALCLALYGKTPRYRLAENGVDITDVKGSTIKQDDVRGILRDGTSNGYAEVEFVGIDGQHYRANWSLRRAFNKAEGNLQAYEISLKNITTNQDVPGRKTELLEETERLVGLNFEQFTRSVLLAQGDFTAFLKAGKDEKSSLLEKLTGTHTYSEISKKVFENHREQQQKHRELNLQREGISTLTAEELSALQEHKAVLESAIKNNEQQIVSLDNEVNWHGQWVKLQEGVKSAGVQYEQASTKRSDAQSREKQLQQIIRVQPVRPLMVGLQNVQEQIASKTKLVEELFAKLSNLQSQKNVLDTAIEQANNNLNTKTQDEEQTQPLLNVAKALDVKLSEKLEQIKQATEEVTTIQDKEKQQNEQLLQTQIELGYLEGEIINLNLWKADNEVHRQIAEQERMILSKLGDAKSILESLRIYTTRVQNAEKGIANRQQVKQGQESQLASIQTSLQQIQNVYKILHTVLSEIPIRDIEKEKSFLDASVEDIIGAEAHWNLLYSAIKEKDELQQSLENNKKEIEQSTLQLAEAEKLLETKKSEKEASAKMLEKAKLVATETVERLRSRLEQEEPCPVCGSATHPYASHHPGLDLVLSELEISHSQIESDYTQQLTTFTGLNQACIQTRKTIATLNDGFLRKETSLKGLESKWTVFQIYEKCKEFPVKERADWLQEQILQQKRKQQQLREQIQYYSKEKEQQETYKTKLTALEKQLNNIENQIKDTDRTLKSLQKQKTNDAGEQKKSNNNLESVQQDLSAYFTSENWFQNWQANPEAFVRRIHGFALEWKNNIVKLEENTRKQSVLAEKLKGIQNQLKNIREEVQVKELKLSGLQLQNRDLSDKRKSIFNGEPAIEVEKRLKEAVNTAKLLLEQQRNEAGKIQDTITRNTAQNEQLEKDVLSLSKKESELIKQFDEWVTGHNQLHGTTLIKEELLLLLAFTQDWIEAERASLRAIDDAVMQAKSIFDERTKTLAIHTEQRPSEKTLEDLIASHTDVRELQKQSIQLTNEIAFIIKEDTSNKKRIGHLLQEIEKQALVVENWAKLNEIIGSADGKKFRQIAQEYTLDVLLSYTNVHLSVLSKRYVLQRIPNSLGLQVIDQDMGDEVRTVYSLSGGESFLVSLALALGLASLSSSRMKVESLFIDEGFGSLDAATLNIAMDALERLHNQGRKVGVISHVQEMTERISVQIKVSKQQSGRSKVEIIQ